MNIGISLSGGGIRATVFHLGALARLAQTDYWNSITHISTVSGGSLCAALIYEHSHQKWPNPVAYLTESLPNAYRLLTAKSLQRAYVISSLVKPWRLLQGRAHVLGKMLEKKWDIHSFVSDMPDDPLWVINATCYETGKNWRFSKEKMGDYKTNYVFDPKYPLSDAIATSAAVPGLIGPLKVKTCKYTWMKFKPRYKDKPIARSLTLWDGGVYDNLGAEYLYKPGLGLQHDIDFYLASDASARLPRVDRKWILNFPLPRFNTRLIDIATDQVRSLRVRELYNVFGKDKSGGVIRIGETAKFILKHHKYPKYNEIDYSRCLDEKETEEAAVFRTTLRKLSVSEFYLLFRHGYETMNSVLSAARSEEFKYFESKNFQWLIDNGN